jgi:UDP-N-acetylglucosamine--N-acetylmuramyl-(pentapeptide) pyrophosphoryl-undecaprenol N-acetylglucosamine transferase
MRIMITGGGTGGHTSPAIAVYEELRKRDPQLRAQWVGCRGKIEERLSKDLGIPFRRIPVAGWPRKRSLKQLWVALKLLAGLGRAVLLLRSFRPQIVFGVGGYVSLPLMWVAQWMGIPTVIHEQNRRLGMANRLLAPRASLVFLSFDDTLGDYPEERAEVVGNPVRQEFVLSPDPVAARKALNLSPDNPVLLVFGGSQGARRINDALCDCVGFLADAGIQVVWATGLQDLERARDAAAGAGGTMVVQRYIDDMASVCAASDLVVGRSGASTTAELAALGKPCILIPYPQATDNHQMQNARAFEEASAGHILEDAACTGTSLRSLVLATIGDEGQLEAMGRGARSLAKPMAGERIAEGMMQMVFGTAPD